MKHLCKILSVTVLFFPSICLAQEPALAGFVFANAIGVASNADIAASGRSLTKKGLEPGMATSGLGLPVGNYQVQVTAQGCEAAKGPLSIQAGATPILVAYLERKLDPQTRTVKNFIRLLQFLSQPQESHYLINVVAVDPSAQFTVQVGGEAKPLVFAKPVSIENKNVQISDAAGAHEEAKADVKGSYYCFVFRKADGKPGISLVPQRIYQW